jgi:hypothetical protein
MGITGVFPALLPGVSTTNKKYNKKKFIGFSNKKLCAIAGVYQCEPQCRFCMNLKLMVLIKAQIQYGHACHKIEMASHCFPAYSRIMI